MKPSTPIIALALCLSSACSGPAPSPTSSDAPAATTSAPATQDAAPAVDATQTPAPATASAAPPAVDPPMADPALAKAILAVFPDYAASQAGDDALPPARYVAARHDLDGDGADEVIVYLMGPFFCGTGGCSLLVLTPDGAGYRQIGDVGTARPPVRIVTAAGKGHADLLYRRSGGGGPTEDVRLAFRDGRYRKASPAKDGGTQTPAVLIADDIDFAQGIALTPSP